MTINMTEPGPPVGPNHLGRVSDNIFVNCARSPSEIYIADGYILACALHPMGRVSVDV